METIKISAGLVDSFDLIRDVQSFSMMTWLLVKISSYKETKWSLVFPMYSDVVCEYIRYIMTFKKILLQVRNGTSVFWPNLEDLFFNYGVDLEYYAHEHSYERLWPLYKGKVKKNAKKMVP